MSPSAVRRHLATVLFLDIVGSTAIANELGDARWRVVLGRFRQLVRRELKRHEGREQDTAGDGFFATFAEPEQALYCAAAITVAVQELGLDVRAGLHMGECEQIDGKLGGVAVHIAARVMSLAGAAEVMATGTVRDLVVGSTARFEDVGDVELKGVGGRWRVCRLRSIEVELPSPLDPDVAAARLSAVAEDAHRRRRRLLPVAAVAVVVVSSGIVAAVITGYVGRAAAGPSTLLRIDARTDRVVSEVRDQQPACQCGGEPLLQVVDGTMWERTGNGATMASRALATGRVIRTFPLPLSRRMEGFAIGFGALWIVDPGPLTSAVDRVDELSGRITARIAFHGTPGIYNNIAISDGAIWELEQDGTLIRIDPATNRVFGRFTTGASQPFTFATGAGYEWICECTFDHSIIHYNAESRTAKTLDGFAPSDALAPTAGAIRPRIYQRDWVIGLDRHTGFLWFLNGGAAQLVPVDPATGLKAAESVGLAGDPVQAVLARGNIWVAAGSVVDRVSLTTGERVTIPLPKGTYAGGIAVDPATNTVWVANSRLVAPDITAP